MEILDPVLLAEIRKKLNDAQFGYDRMDHGIYTKHVTALLKEREQLLTEVVRLQEQLDRLATKTEARDDRRQPSDPLPREVRKEQL